jgi:murein DD-endopeptidase MepM/ murein hydrolase activator NlpD
MTISYKSTSGKTIGLDGRRFFADRNNGARHHVGIDMFCREGDEVVACADGQIVDFQHFLDSHGQATFQLLVEHPGVVINYGEVAADSNEQFHWKRGDTVTSGQRIARIGATAMLHFETYVPGTRVNQRWMTGDPRPPAILNPTGLLLSLAATGTRIGVGEA